MASCRKDDDDTPPTTPAAEEKMLEFYFRFDPDQVRLNSQGQVSALPSNHAAQSPVFEQMSAHYIELCPAAITPLGQGQVLYSAPETTAGGAQAIDFNQSVLASENEVFFSIPLSDVQPGEYPYLRVSLAFQKYRIQFKFGTSELEVTLASFIGYNTYIEEFMIDQESVSVQGNKLQGFWAFETSGNVQQGQAPAGATTVVNPLFATSSVPAGSCVVTGEFADPLVISDSETEDIRIRVSLSTNQSFEWMEVNADGKFEPTAGEQVVDMGVRGMIPSRD